MSKISRSFRMQPVVALDDRIVPAVGLDPNFGMAGLATVNAVDARVAVQGDGHIVFVGGTNDGTGQTVVGRLKADGSVDDTFGVNGRIVLAGNPELRAVVVGADDNIVVAGTSGGAGYVARLTGAGLPDLTFSDDGVYTTDAATNVTAFDTVGIGVDGVVVAGGSVNVASGGTDAVVMRLTATGIADTTFGTGGLRTFDFFRSTFNRETIVDLVVQADGNVLIGGNFHNFNPTGVPDDVTLGAIWRMTPSGAMDRSFNGGGFRFVRVRLSIVVDRGH